MASRSSRLVLCAVLLHAAAAGSQQFEVAAVKPHAPGAPCAQSNTYPGGRLLLSCFTLVQMLREAMDLEPGESDQLTGGPDRVRNETRDVTAKAAGVAGELETSAYRPMLLNLIEQRFQLKLESRKRELKGLELVRDQKSKPRPGLVLNSGAPHRFDLKAGITLTAQRCP